MLPKIRKFKVRKSAQFKLSFKIKIRPGCPADNFTLSSFKDGGEFEDFTLSSLKGKYVLMIFYPVDFGYVTPTEFYHLEFIMPKF